MKTLIAVMILSLTILSCHDDIEYIQKGLHSIKIIVSTDSESCTVEYIKDTRGYHSIRSISSGYFEYNYIFDNMTSEIDIYVDAIIQGGTYVDVEIYINGVLEFSQTDPNEVEIQDHFLL